MNLPIPKGIIYIVLAGMVGLAATFTIHRYVSVKTEGPKVALGQVPFTPIIIRCLANCLP